MGTLQQYLVWPTQGDVVPFDVSFPLKLGGRSKKVKPCCLLSPWNGWRAFWDGSSVWCCSNMPRALQIWLSTTLRECLITGSSSKRLNVFTSLWWSSQWTDCTPEYSCRVDQCCVHLWSLSPATSSCGQQIIAIVETPFWLLDEIDSIPSCGTISAHNQSNETLPFLYSLGSSWQPKGTNFAFSEFLS